MKNLKFNNDILSWINNVDHLVQKRISDLYYAYYNQINELIIAETGINYIPKKIYAFHKDGTPLYELIFNESLTWTFDNNEFTIKTPGLSQIIFAYRIGKILLLFKNKEIEEIQILNLDSTVVCNFKTDKGNKFEFLEQTSENLILVISNEHPDSFGRSQFRYSINEETCELRKIGLNY